MEIVQDSSLTKNSSRDGQWTIMNQAREHPYVIFSFSKVIDETHQTSAWRSYLTKLNHCPKFIRTFRLASNIDTVTLSSPSFRTLATK
jgi:hypothetical protein